MQKKIKKLLLPNYHEIKFLRELKKQGIQEIDEKYNLSTLFIFKKKLKNFVVQILDKLNLLRLFQFSLPRSLKTVHAKYEKISGLYIKLHKNINKLKFIAINEKNKIIECKGLMTPYYGTCLKRLHEFFNLDSILEVGAGELTTLDNLLKKIKKKPKKVGAIDISLKRLSKGQNFFNKKNKKINLLARADASQLPFADNSFDMVYTVHVIEQVPQLFMKILKELVRVSSNIVILIEPSYEFGSNSSKKNILKKGYTRIKDSHFKRLNYKLIYRDILEFRYYINGSEIVVLKKNKNTKNKNKTEFVCPITHENLFKKGNYLSNKNKTINFPIKNFISMLCPEDRI
jgi:ubiquinone/menaquinone biosynthesis C-methylase UbiE